MESIMIHKGPLDFLGFHVGLEIHGIQPAMAQGDLPAYHEDTSGTSTTGIGLG